MPFNQDSALPYSNTRVNFSSKSKKYPIPNDAPSWTLSKRQHCDLHLILNQSFYPLTGFFGKKDYESVLKHMRLSNGQLWPIPITLDVDQKTALSLSEGQTLILKNAEGVALASLLVQDIWQPDLASEVQSVYGSSSLYHPGVAKILQRNHSWYVGGSISPIHPIVFHDFKELRHEPEELKAQFKKLGWNKIIAFQTRNPMHKVHFELTLRALNKLQAGLLIHPVIGETKPGDIDYYTRICCYQHILKYYPKNAVLLSLLPLAMRMAGPREALWHALIRKNYGCTHFIVGRDHAGPGNDPSGKAFYEHYAAQRLLKQHEEEIEIEILPFESMQYVKNRNTYVTKKEVKKGDEVLNISGTELRNLLNTGQKLPDWFTFPEVSKLLKKQFPPKYKQGYTLFFTGLSASGKSTTAQALAAKLSEITSRKITLLDGDLVRKHLSSELGFTKEHRDLNVLRIGFVASEITKHGGIAICSPIAPYHRVRQKVREMIEETGGFLLIHLSTPLSACEQRDCKGLYEKARNGLIPNFTGINDPYEIPNDAELNIDTSQVSIEECCQLILERLEKEGYIQT